MRFKINVCTYVYVLMRWHTRKNDLQTFTVWPWTRYVGTNVNAKNESSIMANTINMNVFTCMHYDIQTYTATMWVINMHLQAYK